MPAKKKAKPRQKPTDKQKYTALKQFVFNRQAYKEGDVLELVPRQAQYLKYQAKIQESK